MADAGKLSQEVGDRYPLINSIVVGSPPSWPWEAVPRFLGLLLAAAENDTPQVCSVLLPDTENISYLTATLLALSRLRSEFPELLHEYATRGLEYGQRVRVLPDGYVYKYGGLWPNDPNSFELRVLDAADKARRTFPVRQILRLEPTERSRPKGKGATPLREFQLSPLDILAGIETGGNTSLFRNHVLYLSARVDFDAIASSICLALSHPKGSGLVHGHDLSSGHITDDGHLARDDGYQRAGEPLVAVTHSPEQLADACEAAPPFAKCVIVTEAEKLARNLQAYDRIAGTQRLLIVASHRSAEAIDVLAGRGCQVWRMSQAELVLDERLEERCHSRGRLGRVFRRIDRWAKLELDPIRCFDDRLDVVARHLQEAASGLDPEHAEAEGARLLGPLFGLLCRASDLCDSPSEPEIEEARRRLDFCTRNIEERVVWLPSAVSSHLREACNGLRTLYNPGSGLGKAKGTAVGELLRSLNVSTHSIAVLTRSGAVAETTDAWLGKQDLRVRVMAIGAMRDSDEFNIIVVTSWPNSRNMGQLVGSYAAPHIYFVGYDFEQAWFLAFKRNRSRRFRTEPLRAAEKAKLTGLSEALFADAAAATGDETEKTVDDEVTSRSAFRIEDILLRHRKGENRVTATREERRPAKYVGFIGAGYALLTQWHHVPVITGLIHDPGAASQSRVPLRTIDHIVRGDVLLFREGGESNIIRALAIAAVGAGQYSRVREVADLWRPSLLRLAENANVGLISPQDIHAVLRRWGLTVTVQALRGWLFDESRIGPGEEASLAAIARAARDEVLEARRTEVWNAIQTIRVWHREAGASLAMMLLDELRRSPPPVGEREARVTLGQGHAWIVEVEEIGDDFEETPVSQINHLRWDERFV